MQRICIGNLLIFLGIKRHVIGLRRIGQGRGCLSNHRRFAAQNLCHPLGQGAELHLGKEPKQCIRVRVAHFEIIQGEIQRCVFVQQHQPPGQADLFCVLNQGLAALGLFDLFSAGEQSFKIAIFVDQQGGSFDPDPRGAGNIIDRISCERLHINNAFGKHAKFFKHAIAVDGFVLHGVQHFDAVPDQLHHVFVRTDDRHPSTGISGLAGQRRDDVVRLEPFHFLAGNVERFGCAPGQRHLGAQILGHGFAIGFVLIIKIIAKRVAALVKYHGHMGGRIRPMIAFDIPLQHIAKPADRANGQPVRFPRQGWQRMIRAENERRPVDQMQMAPFSKSHDTPLFRPGRRASPRFIFPKILPPAAPWPKTPKGGLRSRSPVLRSGRCPRRLHGPLERISHRNTRIQPNRCHRESPTRRGDGQAHLRRRRRQSCGFQRF